LSLRYLALLNPTDGAVELELGIDQLCCPSRSPGRNAWKASRAQIQLRRLGVGSAARLIEPARDVAGALVPAEAASGAVRKFEC
jgi:hypothetical protein